MKSIQLILAVGFLLYLCGCSCDCDKEELVHRKYVIAGNEFIISKIGKENFEKYISFEPEKSSRIENYFEMHYRFIHPLKEFINEEIIFYIDTLGNVNYERDVIGVPDCINNSQLCEFEIDEDGAKSIAQQYNFEEGIKPWLVSFRWNEKLKKYVWHILSTLKEGQGSQGMIGNGKEMIIDPLNGEILQLNEWNIR